MIILLLAFAIAAYLLAPWAWFKAVFLVMPLWGQAAMMVAVFVVIVVIGELLIGDQAECLKSER